MLAQDVTDFWREAGPANWFAKDDAFDAVIRARFGEATQAALDGGFDDWRAHAEGALALALLLDQFPRNLYRGEAKAFSGDGRARELAREALARGFDREVAAELAPFLHLPFMHSEDLADQDLMVALARWRHPESTQRFAVLHRDIIAQFGRFPHRNAALGRETTPQEAAFLARPDVFKG
jgi:uncharacterized protein (DUF924 family)